MSALLSLPSLRSAHTHRPHTSRATRPKDRAERPKRDLPVLPTASTSASPTPGPSRQAPQVTVSDADADAHVDDFSRKLKISTSPRSTHAHPHPHPHSHSHTRNDAGPSKHKLFNPDSDAVPSRRTAEPEAISDTGSSSYAGRGKARDPGPQRHLFDPSKDDPVRFGVRVQQGGIRMTPTPKSSGEYISTGSTSSYAASIGSSFTLSSGTSSSAPSSLFEQQRAADSGSSENAFAQHLKQAYRKISALETKIMNATDDHEEQETRITVKVRKEENEELRDGPKDHWAVMLEQHMEYVPLHLQPLP